VPGKISMLPSQTRRDIGINRKEIPKPAESSIFDQFEVNVNKTYEERYKYQAEELTNFYQHGIRSNVRSHKSYVGVDDVPIVDTDNAEPVDVVEIDVEPSQEPEPDIEPDMELSQEPLQEHELEYEPEPEMEIEYIPKYIPELKPEHSTGTTFFERMFGKQAVHSSKPVSVRSQKEITYAYSCPVCNKGFDNAKSLTGHLNSSRDRLHKKFKEDRK